MSHGLEEEGPARDEVVETTSSGPDTIRGSPSDELAPQRGAGV